MTQADADFKTGHKSGQSYRIAYSKFVSTTSTNLTLATYRYSTGNFYSFTDAIYQQDNYGRGMLTVMSRKTSPITRRVRYRI